MFYRRRGFRAVLPLLAWWGWKRRPFYVFFTPQRFDTAKTRCRPGWLTAIAVQQRPRRRRDMSGPVDIVPAWSFRDQLRRKSTVSSMKRLKAGSPGSKT
jgi:hypothetical protein